MTPPRTRRILVALDASPASLAAAEAAALLAARLEAELAGLFVEDALLLELARQPLARHVDLVSGATRPAAGGDVERQLRVLAARARAAFEALIRRLQVSGSFQVARGHVESEILSAARGVDLVALGRGSWTLGPGRPLGATARAVLAQRGSRVLLLRELAPRVPPVAVAYDGSPAAHRALATAAELAGHTGEAFTVLLMADDAEKARALRAEVEEQLAERGIKARLRALRPHELSPMARAAHPVRSGVLVVPAGVSGREREALLRLLERARGAVLTVNPEEEEPEDESDGEAGGSAAGNADGEARA